MKILKFLFLIIINLQSLKAYTEQLDVRITSRLLLFNEKNELLLMKIEDKNVYDPNIKNKNIEHVRWVTIGGRVKNGETLYAAAKRELLEETGIDNVTIGPMVWTKNHILNWNGRMVTVEDNFFVARTYQGPFSTDAMEPPEKSVFKEFKWWTLKELENTNEILKPSQLSSHFIKDLIDGNIPYVPIILDN